LGNPRNVHYCSYNDADIGGPLMFCNQQQRLHRGLPENLAPYSTLQMAGHSINDDLFCVALPRAERDVGADVDYEETKRRNIHTLFNV
jgi:hypothetical protein